MNIIDQLPNEKPLTLAQEASLKQRGRLTELVMANMREAVLYAKTCNGTIPDDELVSICYETLVKTAAKYNSKHRVRFFAYSKPRLRGALVRHFSTSALVRNGECVSLDCNQATNPSLPRADAEADVSADRLVEHSEEPEFDLIDFRERFAEISETLIRCCNDRERAILMLVFHYSFTFAQAGKCFGLCRAAAQAIASDALARVRKVKGVTA